MQEGVVVVPADGHWLNSNRFIVCWLSYKSPGAVFTWLVYTNSKLELLLGFLKLSHLKFWEGFTAVPELPG